MRHPSEKELILYHYQEAGDRAAIGEHLAACIACRADLERLTQSLAALDAFAAPERGEGYGAGVWRAVRARMRAESPAPRRFAPAGWLQWAQVGWGVALLLVGILVGRYLPGPGDQELRTMRELLTLSLLQQQSASERLAGISQSRYFEQADPRIIGALVQALDHDTDVNVRLAAVDALGRFAGQASIRDQLIESLERQKSPLVQIELIDLLVEQGARSSTDVLRRLADDERTNEYVRQRAEWGLRQVG
ncbi:MAG: HEAT repeat domain-containing protein [Acidobacteriota bacterium]